MVQESSQFLLALVFKILKFEDAESLLVIFTLAFTSVESYIIFKDCGSLPQVATLRACQNL